MTPGWAKVTCDEHVASTEQWRIAALQWRRNCTN